MILDPEVLRMRLSLTMGLMMRLRASGQVPARARCAHAENMKQEGAK